MGCPSFEINVNGEAFFAGNHALALENLPADVVSRIKVYDKRSKMEQFTGVRSRERELRARLADPERVQTAR